MVSIVGILMLKNIDFCCSFKTITLPFNFGLFGIQSKLVTYVNKG